MHAASLLLCLNVVACIVRKYANILRVPITLLPSGCKLGLSCKGNICNSVHALLVVGGPVHMTASSPWTCLDLQERVCDAANIMLWGKATHQQAAQNLAQHGNMPPVLLYYPGIYLTKLQHERWS